MLQTLQQSLESTQLQWIDVGFEIVSKRTNHIIFEHLLSFFSAWWFHETTQKIPYDSLMSVYISHHLYINIVIKLKNSKYSWKNLRISSIPLEHTPDPQLTTFLDAFLETHQKNALNTITSFLVSTHFEKYESNWKPSPRSV